MLWEVAIPGGDASPTVSLTSPAAGATVSGSVALAANASDDKGVSKVDFLVDGAIVASDTSSSGGWTGTWNSATAGDGSHAITARATDTIGQTASDSKTVTVDNVDSPPTVSLTAPADGAAVKGIVGLSASASDDTGVTTVEFLVDGSVVATDTSATGGWTGSWDTSGVGEGPHTVVARATDTKPQSATSGAHQVTVDRTAPGVAISAPVAGATVIGTVAVTADATDAGGVASVQFFRDGVSIGTDAGSSGGWSIDWNSVTAANGPHTLTALATDRAGNTANAAGVAVTVDNPLVVDVPIVASSDDAEQKATNTNVVLNSTDLDMMIDGGLTFSAVGLRFTGVNVPSGATIVDAYVQFTTDEVWTNTTNLTIVGDATANPPTFTATKNNILSRPTTAASVAWPAIPVWSPKELAGPDQRTPDLTPIVQPIVSGQSWVPGNALAFIITGAGRRVAHAYDYGSGVPVLHIEYEIP
jgi:hypothetical protein